MMIYMGCETYIDSLFKRKKFPLLAMLPATKKKIFMSKNSSMRWNENQFSIFEFPTMQKSMYKKWNGGSLQNV